MSLFKSWDELTVVEQLYSEYSDFFKAVNGFRPRFKSVDEWTEKELLEELEDLGVQSDIQVKEETARHEITVDKFYTLLKEVSVMCNTNLTGAMKYLIQAEGDDWYDWGYYCYNNDLPYRFKPEGVSPVLLGF